MMDKVNEETLLAAGFDSMQIMMLQNAVKNRKEPFSFLVRSLSARFTLNIWINFLFLTLLILKYVNGPELHFKALLITVMICEVIIWSVMPSRLAYVSWKAKRRVI